MPGITQEEARKGSQKWMRILVNDHSEIIEKELREAEISFKNESFKWLSPLANDNYSEYKDVGFLNRLSISPKHRSLTSFWPKGGPVWDGLCETNRGDKILIEAKSHIDEMKSSCRAHQESMQLIEASLEETVRHYGSGRTEEWLNGYYQYANRLAHLYFLREINRIDAWLVFIYFLNDSEMKGPSTKSEWQQEICNIRKSLGINMKKLKPYVVDLFIDVNELC